MADEKKELTAQETKEELLWVAKEMLRSNLVQGTAGKFSGTTWQWMSIVTASTTPSLTLTRHASGPAPGRTKAANTMNATNTRLNSTSPQLLMKLPSRFSTTIGCSPRLNT